MSLSFRERVRRMLAKLNAEGCSITEQELQNIMEWCPISDQVIASMFPNQDVDKVIDGMTDAQFRDLVLEVLKAYRERKKKAEKVENDDAQQTEDEEEVEIEEIAVASEDDE